MALWEKRGVSCWERLVLCLGGSAGAGGDGDGANTAWTPLGWGRGVKLSAFKALAAKHKLQPQQGETNSKLSPIRDAAL